MKQGIHLKIGREGGGKDLGGAVSKAKDKIHWLYEKYNKRENQQQKRCLSSGLGTQNSLQISWTQVIHHEGEIYKQLEIADKQVMISNIHPTTLQAMRMFV